MERQILRIKTPGGSHNRYTHITEVCISSILTTVFARPIGFWVTVDKIIRQLESGDTFYYTNQAGKQAYVEVYRIPNTPTMSTLPKRSGLLPSTPLYTVRKRIRTKSDGNIVDNLLSLPNDSTVT